MIGEPEANMDDYEDLPIEMQTFSIKGDDVKIEGD